MRNSSNNKTGVHVYDISNNPNPEQHGQKYVNAKAITHEILSKYKILPITALVSVSYYLSY